MLYSEGREIAQIATACERAVAQDYSHEECRRMLLVAKDQLRDLLNRCETENAASIARAGLDERDDGPPKLVMHVDPDRFLRS